MKYIMPSGYSTTPLAKKLGIKAGFTMATFKEPAHYFQLFSDFPDEVTFIKNKRKESLDFIHLFCTHFKDLQITVKAFKPALKKNGVLWISWPKGGSNIPTDLKRDTIREFLLEAGLVDVKVAAIVADWSGLKFVYRVKDR